MSTQAPSAASELRAVEAFADLADDELDWLLENGQVLNLQPGDVLFREGDPADALVGLIFGEMQARPERNPDARVFIVRTGQLGGTLPFSRMTTFPATSRAVLPSRVFRFPAARFSDMLRRIPALEQRLVTLMVERAREFTRGEQQHEKLLALGKLSAGLAHELNNPAAAVRRSAGELGRRLAQARQAALALAACGVTREQMEALNALVERRQGGAAPTAGLSPLARCECEDELSDWLAERGVEQPWELAEAFVSAGMDAEALAGATAELPPESLGGVLAWLGSELAAEALAAEIDRAAGRISELVAAVKQYSHMDEAPARSDTDLHAGLDSTLTMLGHKLREKNAKVTRDYAADLPRISAYAGELNQVWTNLLDNAVDALAPGGHITLRTARLDGQVLVEIRDDGRGIPPEVQTRIWEPFFTTKAVGEGTGLGLDIVRRIVMQRHGGSIRVESRPGDTCFAIRLPVEAHELKPSPAPGAETRTGLD